MKWLTGADIICRKNHLESRASVIAGAFASAIPSIDTLAMNRVLGLGIDRAIYKEDIDAIIQFYRAGGVPRFFVQISPNTFQKDLTPLLQAKGFRHYNNWTKHFRYCDAPIAKANCDLEITLLDASEASAFGTLICQSFGWKDPRLASWLAASVGQAGYTHYQVKKNDQTVAVGALFIERECASMAFAATLPNFRGLGAQQLLLETRLKKARVSGCRIAVSETAEAQLNKPVPSALNMRRFGFEQAYQRQNWIFEF